MKQLHLQPADMNRGTLLLVNGSHPLRQEVPQDLLTPVTDSCPDLLLDRRARAMLVQLLANLKAPGGIVPVSGYRSFAEQQQIYLDSLQKEGEAFTKQYVAFPGCSEHQTGLAIDLGQEQEEIDFIRPDFPDRGICRAFRQKAAAFGFVLRYPKGKENITKIAWEPWHFRYVGYPHSILMERKGLVLEEYIDYLKRFSQHGRRLRVSFESYCIESFYVGEGQLGQQVLLPQDCLYQVSGNNADGVVVTLWQRATGKEASCYDVSGF